LIFNQLKPHHLSVQKITEAYQIKLNMIIGVPKEIKNNEKSEAVFLTKNIKMLEQKSLRQLKKFMTLLK